MLALHYNLPMDKISLVGLDINTLSVERARAGIFSRFSIRNTEEQARTILEKFIRQTDNGEIKLSEELMNFARFVHGNLFRGLSGLGPFDIVLLRNTLIYIQPGLRPGVLKNLREGMREGGYLILGQIEITGGAFGIFNQEKIEVLTI